MSKRYGWKPDMPDHRDLTFLAASRRPRLLSLPPRISLLDTGWMPPVYDQGDLGSCTANAIAAAIDYERAQTKQPFIHPSRLGIYYAERALEGTLEQDSGAEIRDGIKVVASQGVGPESVWPYDPAKFAQEPGDDYYTAALANVVRAYSRLTGTDPIELKSCLVSGNPFVFGFTVYPGFESDEAARTGTVPMPNGTDGPVGGHAVLCVGYDDTVTVPGAPMGVFIVRNSWGVDWGLQGYFMIPQAYLTNDNLATDFWHVTTVGYGPTQP